MKVGFSPPFETVGLSVLIRGRQSIETELCGNAKLFFDRKVELNTWYSTLPDVALFCFENMQHSVFRLIGSWLMEGHRACRGEKRMERRSRR